MPQEVTYSTGEGITVIAPTAVLAPSPFGFDDRLIISLGTGREVEASSVTISQVTTAFTEIDTLQSDVLALELDVADLQDDIGDIQLDIIDIQADLSTLQGDLIALDLIVGGIQFDIIQLQDTGVFAPNGDFLNDNRILRSDGTVRDAQPSEWEIDDEGLMSLVANDSKFYPSFGSQLADSSGWTSTGWTGSFGAGFTHTPGNTSVLSDDTVLVVGNVYRLSVTISGRTAGGFTLGLGGISQQANITTASGVRREIIRATTTAGISITPQSTFDGTLSNIELVDVTASEPVYRLTNDAAGVQQEFRTGPGSTSFVAIGLNAGRYINPDGSFNAANQSVCIGPNAGQYLGTGYANVCIGPSAAANMSCGQLNVCIGSNAGGSMTNALQNVCIGNAAGFGLISGANAVFIGQSSGIGATGSNNIGIGQSTLAAATGSGNTCIGNTAGNSLTSAASCVFVGASAGNNASQLLTGSQMIGIGASCYVTGASGIAIGASSVAGTTSVSIGVSAGNGITGGGSGNFCIGSSAGLNAALTNNNFALATSAMSGATLVSSNIAIGGSAMASVTGGGSFNIAIGAGAMGGAIAFGSTNTCIGTDSGRGLNNSAADNNTFIGVNAGNSGQTANVSNSTAIGNGAVTTSSNQMSFGNSSVTQNNFRGRVTITDTAALPNTNIQLVDGTGTIGNIGATAAGSFVFAPGSGRDMVFSNQPGTATAAWLNSGDLNLQGAVIVLNEPGNDNDVRMEGDTLTHAFFLDGSAATENIALVATAAPNWQSMDRGLFIGDTSTAPTGNPSSGIFAYSSAGDLIVRNTQGAVTTLSGITRGATASVADGGTITHNLGTTPTGVIAQTTVSGEFVSVTALSSTTFTVAIKKHDNSAGTTQTIYWEAFK